MNYQYTILCTHVYIHETHPSQQKTYVHADVLDMASKQQQQDGS